jgi:hypothetical protein
MVCLKDPSDGDFKVLRVAFFPFSGKVLKDSDLIRCEQCRLQFHSLFSQKKNQSLFKMAGFVKVMSKLRQILDLTQI